MKPLPPATVSTRRIPRGGANVTVNNLPALLSAVAALERSETRRSRPSASGAPYCGFGCSICLQNESDPNEPVADNGATVWDHIRATPADLQRA